MLTALRSKVEELAGFRSGVTEEVLEQRLAESGERVQDVAGRIDALTATVDSAVANMSGKEQELATMHRHFTESSERIESVVGDIRAALAAFPDPGAANVDEVVMRMDRVVERVESFEATTREAAEASERASAALANRIEAIEQQVTTVASEVERAKTLWPVALRSLEARLDDATTHPPRPDITAVPDESPTTSSEEPAPANDLLAGLRDSLQAMESVAAEMARASDTAGAAASDESDDDEPVAAAGGGTIVPLRSPDG
jgi:chromosome segregation ATPase